MAYHDNNKRELELTRHVSLRQLDPARAAHAQDRRVVPGHDPGMALRPRLSRPLHAPHQDGGGVGPVGGRPLHQRELHALAACAAPSARPPSLKDDEYARQGTEDDRFIDYTGAIQSIVTSTGDERRRDVRDEPGIDDRFLPFEGAGAISTWKIDLPKKFRAFDYSSVKVALDIRYTARQGVQVDAVETFLKDLFAQATASGAGLTRLFNLQQDFPDKWTAFTAGGNFQATVRLNQFPYFTQDRTITITGMELYGQSAQKLRHHQAGNPAAATTALQDHGSFAFDAAPDPAGPTQVLTRNVATPVFLMVEYTVED